jgi:two-component system, OmpR family, sensor histidine kinase SenX3
MWGRNSARHGDPSEPGTDDGERLPFEEMSKRLQAALDVIGEGILICDQDGEVAFRNAAAGRYLTSAPTDALAVQAVSELTREALAGHTPDRQLDLLSPTRRSLSIRAFPIVGPAGVEGAVAVVEDITERLRLESVRRDFVANVTHELKTPTGALALLAETIEGEDDLEVIARLAQRMGGEADRLVRIIDDLLDLSRIEVNETPQKVLVPVDEIIGEAIDSLQALAVSLEVTLKVGDTPRHLAVPGDRRDLISAVSNLVDNAIKYSEAGGEVYVELREVGSGIEVSVTDRGVGIPSRDLERIFERFYRVDRARSRATGGTGLGLSIVRHVTVNHGGCVTVDSKEGEGSTFVLCLPAVALAAGSEATIGGDEILA